MADDIENELATASAWRPEMTPEMEKYADELRAKVEPKILAYIELREFLGLSQWEASQAITGSFLHDREPSVDFNIAAVKRLAEAGGGTFVMEVRNQDGEVLDLTKFSKV